jgi:hypothetical protein
MISGNFTKVFDIADVGFRDWTFPAVGLIFVAIGIGLVLFPSVLRTVNVPYFEFEPGIQKFGRYAFAVFAIVWTVAAFWGTYSQHQRHASLLGDNQCRVVEGQVEKFVPMPYEGHANESFSVSGVHFAYSDYIVTDGFDNTSSHGGPITAESYVRICYDPRDNAILRLEIRDFKGAPKDYSGWSDIFPFFGKFVRNGNDGPESPAQYGIVFVLLFLLDLLGIRMLFLPYLRLFFPIGTASGLNHRLPSALEPDRTIDLANTTIYWDQANHTIWLRPSGFNLLQVPSTVAKLNVDAMDRRIIGSEIRFSSAMILSALLMLWIAYQFFSNLSAKSTMPPAGFIAFGVFAIFAVVMNMRTHRGRMQKLIDGATAELSIM